MIPNLAPLVTALLALSILPSFTALSDTLRELAPSLFKYSGPLNPLKLGAPLLLLYLWQQRKQLPTQLKRVLLLAFALGTLTTWIASHSCDYPTGPLREWFVISLSSVAALCLWVLPTRNVRAVIFLWVFFVFGSGILDMLAPSVADWLYQNVFDPQTKAGDAAELGNAKVLTGIFGRQSMAKLLAWTPWLLLAQYLRSPIPAIKGRYLAFGLALLGTAAILATSQRGPFVASLAGWCAFALHQWLRCGNRKIALYSGAAVAAALALTPLIVPRPILETRVRSMLGMKQHDVYGQIADGNRDFRARLARFNLKMIGKYPLGNQCVTLAEFNQNTVWIQVHSHNLILEQFRQRGWIWGVFHLALWGLALIRTWRSKSPAASALTAGLVVIWVGGMFDHPWFVLSQAVVLCTFLFRGLFNENPTRS